MADKKVSIIYTLKDKASKGLNKLRGSLGRLGKGFDKARTHLVSFTKGVTVLSAAAAGISTFFLKASGSFEQWEISFTTMLGSAEKAKVLLKDIAEFAAETPFQLTGLIESSKQLIAFGVQQEDVIETMRRLGDIAAGVGTDKLPTLVRAFGKIQAKGKASMEELNMLLEAGVPILDELAKNYDVSTEKLLKMVTQGKVGFDDVNTAIQTLTGEASVFGGLMEKQSLSLFGVLSNIKDNITQFAIAIGNELLPAAKELATAVKNITRVENIPDFVKKIKFAFVDIQTFIKIRTETMKELIAAPFSWETYKTIVEELGSNISKFFDAIKSGWEGIQQFRRDIQEKELEEGLTLEEEIVKIREAAELKKEEIRNSYRQADIAAETEALNIKKRLIKDEIASVTEASAIKQSILEAEKNHAATIHRDLLTGFEGMLSGQEDAAELSAKAILKHEIKRALSSVRTKAIEEAAKSKLSAPLSFGASLLALVPIALAEAAAISAINSIKLAQGGVVKAKSGGTSAIIGEAGRDEAVIPLDSKRGRDALGNGSMEKIVLEADGVRVLAKAVYKKQTDMLRTGELQERL